MRQFHTTPIPRATEPWYRRMRDTIFGDKESEEAKRVQGIQREGAVEMAQTRDPNAGLETKTDEHGNVYEIAVSVDKLNDRDYVPATSWHGLDRIGGDEWLRQQQDEGDEYQGFNPGKEVRLSDEQWAQLIHHVAVEALTVQFAGKDILQICADSRSKVLPTGEEHTRAAAINSENGTLSWTSHTSEQAVLNSISNETSAPQSGEDAQIPQVKSQSSSQNWLDFNITDPLVEFAITKRIYQLTGRRVSDPILGGATSLRRLKSVYVTRSATKKLAQTRQMKKLHKANPNIRVYATRRSPILKDREVGRWKLMKEELISRGLPVTGSNWVDASEPLPSLVYGDKKAKWKQDSRPYQISK
ncbi:hypothetical protein K431DRAFT_291241 [Polychaeton citri CBS 116435]|uniref:Large ribosomal subunit protein mL50 n=1 Tax=Polychaeton citri CBS 116435 TaxID=1314669 RepID=A0A9P4QEQ4_9PEZI|nr:hypothetical protein K431DRAFT_291241 [Polychaeton citri CBS 116435]